MVLTTRDVLYTTDGYRIVELNVDDIPAMQQLYEANPEYSQSVLGRPSKPSDAHDDFHDRPPTEFPMGRKWMLGFVASDDALIGVAEIVSDLFASSVWHIGYFMIATKLHGGRVAAQIYDALESYMRIQGAHWVRLGVVVGNVRAERFWERCGFVEVRQRENYALGLQRHTLRVMVKPLHAGSLHTYLALVERDRPA